MLVLPPQQSAAAGGQYAIADHAHFTASQAKDWSLTMPTYEYACPKCGIVEAFQSIKEDALTKCPQCKKAKVQRMVSMGGGVIFKGSGFWETDYNRSSDYQSKSKTESGGTAKTDAPATTPASTTPATTPAPATTKTSTDVAPQPKAQSKPAALKPKS